MSLVVQNPPARVGDMGPIPGPGKSQLRGTPKLVHPKCWGRILELVLPYKTSHRSEKQAPPQQRIAPAHCN